MKRPAEVMLHRQQADGGLPATPGLESDAESTALALLALRSQGETGAADRACAWLRRQQRRDGAWPINGAVPGGSWATAWCVVALADDAGAGGVDLERAGAWLVAREGRRPSWLQLVLRRVLSPGVRAIQDDQLLGWPWHGGAFSWVEPTAVGMLALERLGATVRGGRSRVAAGAQLLLDRMCVDGGWNYGNSVVLEERLPPYPDQTAIALIALQGHGADAAIRQSLRVLEGMLETQSSVLSLAWGVLCLHAHGIDTGRWQSALVERLESPSIERDTRSHALAALALGPGREVFVP